jgi:polyisoprenyl-phosphate glycosyltransferase
MAAGLDHCCGSAAVVIDSDLQDPPEQLPAMVAEWRQGADIVLMQRASRTGESRLKMFTASWFYRVLNAGQRP